MQGSPLTDVRVRFYAGDPRKGGRVIGTRTIKRVEPYEHGLAEIMHKLPAGTKKANIYAVAEHTCGPRAAPQ